MIRMSVSVKTVKNEIGELSRRAQQKTKQIIADDAQITKADAMARSRVDTGEMKKGWTAFNTDAYTYELRNDVPHVIFNELGTVNMSAQPMATPAIESARQRLPKALADAFK